MDQRIFWIFSLAILIITLILAIQNSPFLEKPKPLLQPPATCGDGIQQESNSQGEYEQCDTSDLSSMSCGLFGFEGGNLKCTSTCEFDISNCVLGPGPRYDVNEGIGINIAHTESYTNGATQIIFNDAMKHSITWRLVDSSGNEASSSLSLSELDENGWPKESPINGNYPQARLFWGTYIFAPAGDYTLIFEGDGTIKLGDAYSGTYTNPGGVFEETFTMTDTFEFLSMTITDSNPSDPVRNIKVIMPGYADVYEEDQFYEPFSERLDIFGTARMYNLMMPGENVQNPYYFSGTGGPINNWDDRRPFWFYTQSAGKGISPEYLIAIANKAGLHPWYTVPHEAEDDYVRELARLTAATLDPRLKVYVEHSNELWNSAFPQNSYTISKANSLDLGGDSKEASAYYHAKRSAEIHEIFNDEVGEDRVIAYLGVWDNNYKDVLGAYYTNVQGFESQASSDAGSLNNEQLVNPNGIKADAVGNAPYFGRGIDSGYSCSGGSANSILNELEGDVSSGRINGIRSAANSYGLKYSTYEGGISLESTDCALDDTLTQEMIKAGKDSRMKTIYLDYLDTIYSAGLDMLTQYGYVRRPNQFGQWNVLEYQDQPTIDAPKYQAFEEYVNENFPPTQDTNPVCGNSWIEIGEDCDDGNTLDNDICPATCIISGPPPPPPINNQTNSTDSNLTDTNISNNDNKNLTNTTSKPEEKQDTPQVTDTDWTTDVKISENQLKTGFEITLKDNERIIFEVSGNEIYIGITGLRDGQYLVLNINGVPAEIEIGSSKNYDFNNDGELDTKVVAVTADISDSTRTLRIESIKANLPEPEERKLTSGALWFIIIAGILLIIIVIVVRLMKEMLLESASNDTLQALIPPAR
jgi:cysteine-rich repeat protein